MSHIRLEHLILRNFKGVRDFTLDAQCDDVAVFGQNAAGKSTLLDAFTWLLFSKDSLNQSDFEIKTLTAEGESLHNLSHEVEALLLVDGRPVHLRKVYAEKWTKKRGQAHQEFSGHTTDHFIDGVPVQKKEYDQRVAAIAGESAFRLLTSPTYFNEALDWKKRRALLLEICGDVSDAEVVESDKGLAALPEILGNRSLEDQRKVIDAKRKEINKELQGIPLRIEATRALLDVSDIAKPEAINADAAALREELSAARQRLADTSAGGAITARRVAMQEIEAELRRVSNEQADRDSARYVAARRELTSTQARVQELTDNLTRTERRLSNLRSDIPGIESRIQTKRVQWSEISAETYQGSTQDACPTCGQSLPHEHVEAAREKALASFNRDKAERLERNVAAGKALRAELDTYHADEATMQKESDGSRVALTAAKADLDRAEETHRALGETGSPADLQGNPEYVALTARRDALAAEIKALEADSSGAADQVRAQIVALEERTADIDSAVVRIAQRQKGEQRITQLQDDEARLAAEFEELEAQLYLCDQFTRAKVDMLTERINARFRIARFKLFETQINEGLREVCEVTVNGVPYSSLNHGHRIAAGIDICNVLSEHYGLAAPIWLDNSESLTVPIETDSQLIRLVVSEGDKTLRVERATERAAV